MLNEPVVTTAFVLSRDEFKKAHRILRRNLPMRVKWPGWVQCILLVSLFVLPVAYQPDDRPQPFGLLMLALVWGVLVMGSVSANALLNLQFERMRDKEIRYEFGQDGIATSMLPDGGSHLSWSAIGRFKETDALFVLQTGILFYTIPKRALATGGSDKLRELLTTKVVSNE